MGIFKTMRQKNKNIAEFTRLARQPGGEQWVRKNVEAQAQLAGASQSEVLVLGAEAMRQVDARNGRSVEEVMEAITQSLLSGKVQFSNGRPMVQVITPQQAAAVVHGVLDWTRPSFYDEFQTIANRH